MLRNVLLTAASASGFQLNSTISVAAVSYLKFSPFSVHAASSCRLMGVSVKIFVSPRFRGAELAGVLRGPAFG